MFPTSLQGWRTKPQLLELHRDSQAVEGLVQRKKEQGLFRYHPDFPGDAGMLLYYVPNLNLCRTMFENLHLYNPIMRPRFQGLCGPDPHP